MYYLSKQTITLYAHKPSRHSSVGKASALQQWLDRSQFWAPPMSAHRYMEENGWPPKGWQVLHQRWTSEHVTHMPPPSVNEAAHSGFDTQRRHQNRGTSGPTKWLVSFKNLKKKKLRMIIHKRAIFIFGKPNHPSRRVGYCARSDWRTRKD